MIAPDRLADVSQLSVFIGHQLDQLVEILEGEPGPVFELEPGWGLVEKMVDRRVVTVDEFHADIERLPFPNETFACTIGVRFLDWIDGMWAPKVLAELARVSRTMFFILACDVLSSKAPAMRSTLQKDGSYVTEFSRGWWQGVATEWPGDWMVRIVPFRVTTGALILCGRTMAC